MDSIKKEPESRKDWMLKVFEYHGKLKKHNRHYNFWIQDNHPTILITPKVIWEKVNYIHFNPVKAGIVQQPEHYLYSSAKSYSDLNWEGMVDVELLPPHLSGGHVFIPS